MRSIPLFQFTCPSRSTTKGDGQSLPNNVFQFTCPSRSTTAGRRCRDDDLPRFNSRAPRGARLDQSNKLNQQIQFQFTCPSRSTTSFGAVSMMTMSVSIHVPLAEHDTYRDLLETDTSSFNSRAPRGARLPPFFRYNTPGRFNSRAPRGARPQKIPYNGMSSTSFNSRAPRGARPQTASQSRWCNEFQFTCPSRSTTSS